MQKGWKNKFLINAKINQIVFKIIYYLSIIFIMYSIIYSVNTTITKKEYLDIFGIKLFSINDNLMKKDLNKNDLAIIQETKDLKIGDIIAYKIGDQIRINKILNIYNDDNTGQRRYVTKYNQNYNPDIEELTSEQIIGKKIVRIVGLGFILRILQSKISIVLSIIILIIYFVYNKYIYRKQKERLRKKKKQIDNI